jgi:hypothetical protein
MAQFETWLKSDLQQPVKVIPICGNVFTQDNMANRVGVEVYDGGEAVTLSGTVQGCIIRADDATVIQTGSLSGNKAWVDLPESAYAIPGQIQIAIRLVSGDAKTVLGACTSFVSRSVTGSIVDPGHVIPSIDELLALIDDMEDAIAASENVNISQSKSGNTVTIVTTNRNGVATTTQLHDGADGHDGTNGTNGNDGADGDDGATFTPAVSSAGVISWTNDKGRTNPQAVDITAAVIAALPSAVGVNF